MMSKPGEEEDSKTKEISPVLFLETSGHSMRFYVRPGPTKMQLHPLITNGGGILCRNQEPGVILLVDPGDVTSAMACTGQTYISTKFIRDCAEQNQLLDLDDYVISVGPSVQTRMAARHQGNGRLGYSPEDDAAILKFMEKRQHEAKGNLVWKEMEKRRVTDHSWQSMKDRFLKHLQHKLTEKSPTKSPSAASKRKALTFTQCLLSKKKVTQTSEPETDTLQQSVAVSDSSETQIGTESSLCLTVRTNPPPSPERASSPLDVPEVAREPPHAPSHDSQDKSCVLVQEQETPGPEMSTSPTLDEDCDGRDIPDGSNENSFLNKTKQTSCKTSTADSKKLGILEKAAREFEDSDVMDESEEVEDPCEAPIVEPSDMHESSASPATFARGRESQAEQHEEAQQDSPAPEEELPGPSSTASNGHVFMFDSESREQNHSQARGAPEETPPRLLVDVKEHVKTLMRETKKDLVEVTKALLKANGDLTSARVYLLDGYEHEIHGPLWNHLDDEVLLLADPYELEQLQSKFGEEEVTRRRAFLTAGKN